MGFENIFFPNLRHLVGSLKADYSETSSYKYFHDLARHKFMTMSQYALRESEKKKE